MLEIVLRFIFTYSTVTGRKCEMNIIVIVIVAHLLNIYIIITLTINANPV